jgi:hypothetical protein
MATVIAIQAELDPQGYGNQIEILKQFTVGTTDTFYCLGGQVRPGRARWCEATNTDSAAQQATSITNAMIA